MHGMKRARENGEQGAGELGRRRGEKGYGMDKGYGGGERESLRKLGRKKGQ